MEKFKGDLNKLNLPDGLDEKDLELIVQQCEIQSAISQEQVEGFAKAYWVAKQVSSTPEILNNLTKDSVEDFILRVGALIEPKNSKGFRKVNVRFANHSSALSPDKIERAMESFCNAFAEAMREGFFKDDEQIAPAPIELYREFELIHPFEDGNGRVGDLLWKIAMTKWGGEWPKSIPPDIFNTRL